jgi:hypothetical protein
MPPTRPCHNEERPGIAGARLEPRTAPEPRISSQAPEGSTHVHRTSGVRVWRRGTRRRSRRAGADRARTSHSAGWPFSSFRRWRGPGALCFGMVRQRRPTTRDRKVPLTVAESAAPAFAGAKGFSALRLLLLLNRAHRNPVLRQCGGKSDLVPLRRLGFGVVR